MKNRAWIPILLGSVAVVVGLAILGHTFVESLRIQGIQAFVTSSVSLKEAVGFLAGFGTTFAALPDLISMLRRRSSLGMNPRMAAIMGAFQVLWIWYGLLIASDPVIIWNTIAVVINLLTVAAYFHFAMPPGQRAAR
jgi:uncharacterized protein with PQ loop repeat